MAAARSGDIVSAGVKPRTLRLLRSRKTRDARASTSLANLVGITARTLHGASWERKIPQLTLLNAIAVARPKAVVPGNDATDTVLENSCKQGIPMERRDSDHMVNADEPADPFEASKLEDGIGMSMSGGGFRAMLFHLGALWRLNDLGLLPKITRFSSVSGGSITNGALAMSWPQLGFLSSGVSPRFPDLVARPLLALAKQRVDIPAILIGLVPFLSTAKRVSAAYDRAIFDGKTLQDIPTTPRFTFNATNLMTTGLVRFSPEYAADYRVGRIERPAFRLADVVAASSAFPPLLSPFRMKLEQPFVPFKSAVLGYPPYTEKVVLTDGGVYDNLGLETVWKRYRTIIASNAGRNVAPQKRPWSMWPLQLNRVVNVIFNQVDNARERQLLALARAKLRTVAYWSIETDPNKFRIASPLSLTEDELHRSAAISTRLTAIAAQDRLLLVRHGYWAADCAVRKYVDSTLPVPVAFPDVAALL